MNQLQTVLDALNRVSVVDDDCDILAPDLADAVSEAIAIVRRMMQAEPENLQRYEAEIWREDRIRFEPDSQGDWVKFTDVCNLYPAPQAVPAWLPASNPPTEAQGEVLVLMQDGTCEIAWTTYWHGSSNAFAGWTFRDPDMEDATPTHWMPLPAAPKGAV